MVEAAKVFYFGEVLFQCRSDGGRGRGPADFKAAVLVVGFLDAEDAVSLWLEAVIASLVGDILEDQQAASDAYRQAQKIEEGIALPPCKIADGYTEEVF